MHHHLLPVADPSEILDPNSNPLLTILNHQLSLTAHQQLPYIILLISLGVVIVDPLEDEETVVCVEDKH